jgi:hypothetical protein
VLIILPCLTLADGDGTCDENSYENGDGNSDGDGSGNVDGEGVGDGYDNSNGDGADSGNGDGSGNSDCDGDGNDDGSDNVDGDNDSDRYRNVMTMLMVTVVATGHGLLLFSHCLIVKLNFEDLNDWSSVRSIWLQFFLCRSLQCVLRLLHYLL